MDAEIAPKHERLCVSNQRCGGSLSTQGDPELSLARSPFQDTRIKDLLFICENFMFRDGSGFCANFFLLWTAWSAGSFITNTDNRCLSPIEVSLHFAKRFTCHSKRHVRGSGPLLDPHTNQKKSFCILARNIFGHDRNQMWRSTNRGSLLLLDLDHSQSMRGTFL